MKRYIFPSLLILLSGLYSWINPSQNALVEQILEQSEEEEEKVDQEYISVRWQLLHKLDYKANEIKDPKLQEVLDKKVKIPGFAVPLTDNLQTVGEFLLVPNQMACIHVPAPPPNLIVYIKLDEPVHIEEIIGPIWVKGILRLNTLTSVYGSSSYDMKDVQIESYY